MRAGISSFSDFKTLLKSDPPPTGCFVDTTILFSATYPLDLFNEEAEAAFADLSETGVPVFTNVNVRAEFLEHHRRVLIAESLIDLLEQTESQLSGPLLEKLKSHRTMYRRRVEEERSTKMDVNQIKMFRALFAAQASGGKNGWEAFCAHYLHQKLVPLWRQTEEELQLNFISLRSGDQNPYLDRSPEWETAVDLMGRHGIASSDAMILNMFLCSKVPILLTADLEMAACGLKESRGSKKIFVPNIAL